MKSVISHVVDVMLLRCLERRARIVLLLLLLAKLLDMLAQMSARTQ